MSESKVQHRLHKSEHGIGSRSVVHVGVKQTECVIAEFTQGMILPTANGMAKIQSTSQSKAKLDKTQVGDARCIIMSGHSSRARSSFLTTLWFFLSHVGQISSSSSTSAPVNTGVKIPTCKFSMREKFLTSPADLYRVFLHQEVSFITLFILIDDAAERTSLKCSCLCADGPGVHARSSHGGRREGRKVSPARRKRFR